jgi:hypothetical protein
VEEFLSVAIPHLPVVHVPPPNPEQAQALRTTSAYLNQAGTQFASVLLGFPPQDPNTAALAEFSTLLLRSAALCEGLLELTDDLDRQ